MRDSGRRLGEALAFATLLAMAATAATAAGDPELVAAARNRDPRQVRDLLDRSTDVNSRSDDGSTALLWAAHWNDVETATLLVRAGADPNLPNEFRMTPLSQACLNGSSPLVDLLLAAGASPNTAIATGETPIMTCARAGDPDTVALLVARGADVNAAEPVQDQTALMWAASEHHAVVVSALLEAGADPGARTRRGFTALHFAARQGDIEVARRLLARGVDIDVRSVPAVVDEEPDDPGRRGGMTSSISESAGSTPLLVATVRGQVPFALFLLEQGADPDAADAGLTPLHWASTTWETGTANPIYGLDDPMAGIQDREAKLRLVRALLARGADPNARITHRLPGFAGGYQDEIGATPFLLASSIADLEMMQILLDAGADPTIATATKTTALMAATALNHPIGESPVTEQEALEAVRFLLELGLSAVGANANNENTLFGPAYRGWNTLLELMIQEGADVNMVSTAKVTPWLAASGLGDRLGGVLFNTEGAALLERYGADPTLGTPCQAQNKCR